MWSLQILGEDETPSQISPVMGISVNDSQIAIPPVMVHQAQNNVLFELGTCAHVLAF